MHGRQHLQHVSQHLSRHFYLLLHLWRRCPPSSDGGHLALPGAQPVLQTVLRQAAHLQVLAQMHGSRVHLHKAIQIS